MSALPPYFNPDSRIASLWNSPLSEAASLPHLAPAPEEAERHFIYSLLLMSIVHAWWNGNKNGARDGTYPWRDAQRREDGSYLGDRLGDRYVGHNIGAIAVDGHGRIVDFDLNHNKLFNSSVQHAEARLIRRMFGLAAVQDSWDLAAGPRKYRTDLTDTTVYTSLESCAQCSGIMALSMLPRVFYLQPDPGQYMIAQLMHSLSDAKVAVHVPASAFGFPYFDDLVAGYGAYQKEVADKPFYRPDDPAKRTEKGAALTSFLCTDLALSVYASAAQHFQAFDCQFADHAPINETTKDKAMSNAQVLSHARQFLDYVKTASQRATPHFN